MVHGLLCFVAILMFWMEKVSAVDKKDYLKVLFKYKAKGPFVAVFYDSDSKYTADSDILVPDITPVQPPHDQELYNLYHVLRTTQDNEEIDHKTARTFEKTENILREALRARCNILDTCIQKCPPKKKYTCTFTCKEEYDERDLCEKPKNKKCSPPKCGRTMPPSWLLRNKNI